MNKNKKGKYIWLTLIFCFGLILSIIFSKQLKYTIVPMQNGINRIGFFLSERANAFNYRQILIEENRELQEQLSDIKFDNYLLQQERIELEHLRRLREVDALYSDYEKIGAEVIYKNPNNTLYNSFKINKGSLDGIKVDMNVIADGGLVGIITKTGANWSSVRSIIDDDSCVGAEISSTSGRCITRGNLKLMKEEGVISFNMLETINTDINEGDSIVTSDYSSKYFKGILIGYVSNISLDSNITTLSGEITPAVDFSHIEEVLVITDLK